MSKFRTLMFLFGLSCAAFAAQSQARGDDAGKEEDAAVRAESDQSQCEQAEDRLDAYESWLRAKAAEEGADARSLQPEFERLEAFRENLSRHCGGVVDKDS